MQVLPDPAKVVEYLGLGQPARQADEQGYVVGGLHFEPLAHLAVGHVSAQKRETYSQFFCPLGKLSGQGLVGVQVGCNNLHPLHEFGQASSDGLQGTKEIVGKAARSSEYANLPSRLQARLQFGFVLPRRRSHASRRRSALHRGRAVLERRTGRSAPATPHGTTWPAGNG